MATTAAFFLGDLAVGGGMWDPQMFTPEVPEGPLNPPQSPPLLPLSPPQSPPLWPPPASLRTSPAGSAVEVVATASVALLLLALLCVAVAFASGRRRRQVRASDGLQLLIEEGQELS
eukprot:7346055-Prymnesium_polylepis.1